MSQTLWNYLEIAKSQIEKKQLERLQEHPQTLNSSTIVLSSLLELIKEQLPNENSRNTNRPTR